MKDDAAQYLEELASKISRYSRGKDLGDEMQSGIRLAKTDKEARTNARIEAAQKKEVFDESLTPKDELENINNDIMNELINRAIEDIFGE